MKKTNQARERISPHLKKGEDNSDPTAEKRSSVDAKLKDVNVKSTGNFSTASNDEQLEMTSANATAAKPTGRGGVYSKAMDGNKTALEGHVQTMQTDSQFIRQGLNTSQGGSRYQGMGGPDESFHLRNAAVGQASPPQSGILDLADRAKS